MAVKTTSEYLTKMETGPKIRMAFQNKGRYVRADPDLDKFAVDKIDMLNNLREWGSSEMRSALLAAEDSAEADPREAFKRLGRIYNECQANAVLKLGSEWCFDEKYKKVAMDYMEAGFYDSANRDGNRDAIVEACHALKVKK